MLEVEWMSERDVGMMINHKYAFDIMLSSADVWIALHQNAGGCGFVCFFKFSIFH